MFADAHISSLGYLLKDWCDLELFRTGSVHEFYRLKGLITNLEQVNTPMVEKKKRILISKTLMVGLTGRVVVCCMQMSLVMSLRFFCRRWLKWRAMQITFFYFWQWCNFSPIEALGFSCIYTRVQSATADVFPVVYLSRVPGKRD